MSKRLALQILLLLLGIGLFVGAHGQSSSAGNITGTVRDPQGVAIAKAEVTIKDQNTGASRTVSTNNNGFYSATSLSPGLYTVSVAPQGFKKTVVSDVKLRASENKTVNLEARRRK